MELRRHLSRDADVEGREHASAHLPSTYPPSLPPSFPSSIHPPFMNSSRHPSSIHHLSVHPYTHPLFIHHLPSMHSSSLPPSFSSSIHPPVHPCIHHSMHHPSTIFPSIYHLFVPYLPPSYIHGSIYAFIICYPSIDPLHLTLFTGQMNMS